MKHQIAVGLAVFLLAFTAAPAQTITSPSSNTSGGTCGALGGDLSGTCAAALVGNLSHVTNGSLANSGLAGPVVLSINGASGVVTTGGTISYTTSHSLIQADCNNMPVLNGASLTVTLATLTPPCRVPVLNLHASALTVSRGGLTVNGVTTGQWTSIPQYQSVTFSLAPDGLNWEAQGPNPLSAADVVALFSTCSGVQYLGADAACHNAASATPGFNVLASGTNSAAAMLVGSGASLAPTGTGTISATALNGQALSALATCLLKNITTTGVPVCGVSGTDYDPPTTGTFLLRGNGSGGTTGAISATLKGQTGSNGSQTTTFSANTLAFVEVYVHIVSTNNVGTLAMTVSCNPPDGSTQPATCGLAAQPSVSLGRDAQGTFTGFVGAGNTIGWQMTATGLTGTTYDVYLYATPIATP